MDATPAVLSAGKLHRSFILALSDPTMQHPPGEQPRDPANVKEVTSDGHDLGSGNAAVGAGVIATGATGWSVVGSGAGPPPPFATGAAVGSSTPSSESPVSLSPEVSTSKQQSCLHFLSHILSFAQSHLFSIMQSSRQTLSTLHLLPDFEVVFLLFFLNKLFFRLTYF